uniref:THUMP domain-containing protein n=1 Tax=Trichuris muris TaxID=70415 RepID=A0A5S6Q8D3_TRIMR
MANKRRFVHKRKCEATEPSTKRPSIRRDKALSVGMKGIFFTTSSGKGVDRCSEEAVSLIKEYLIGSTQPSEGTSFEKVTAADTGESLKNCIDELSTQQADGQQLFSVATGVKNTLFVVIPNADPVDLVMNILNDVKTGARKPSHLLQRLLPCQVSCAAKLEDICKITAELLKAKFTEQLVEKKPSFAVVYRHRNNGSLKSQEIYDHVIREIKALSPESKVCLRSPNLYILVNIVKTVCCLSILENYNELKGFNWASI